MMKRLIIFVSSFLFLGHIFIGFSCPERLGALVIQSEPGLASSSSFLPVGSGARAMGMAGAFIAIADDATAASWNPGGLAQLIRPQISMVGNIFIRQDHSTFDDYPEAASLHHTTRSHLNYFSLAYPVPIFNRNFFFALNYQHLYEMNLQYHRSFFYQEIQGSTKADLTLDWDCRKQGGLNTISPALAVQINEALALGATINFWPRRIASWENGWTKNTYLHYQGVIDDTLPFNSTCQKDDHYTLSGTNLHLGFRWQINSHFNAPDFSTKPIFTLGGVIKTSFSAKLDHEFQTLTTSKGNQSTKYDYAQDNQTETLVMPPSYGLGLSVRFSDSFTLSFDIYRTEWGKHKLLTPQGTFSPITEAAMSTSSVKPTHHLRLGGEYLMIKRRSVIALRLGCFYDPDPSENNPDDFYGLTFGSGLALRHIDVDLAYQLRMARDLSTVNFQGETDRDDISQHLLYFSVIYRL